MRHLAFPPPPTQVVRDFIGEFVVALEQAETPAETQAALSSHRERQRLWLSRKRGAGKASPLAPWRPPKRPRLVACKVLEAVDHQLRTAGLQRGLAHFLPHPPLSWGGWPCLSLALDQDSANMAAFHWAAYSANLNLDDQWDHGHGAWNDCKLAAKSTGLFSVLMSVLFVFNLVHGPWESPDGRI